MPSDTRGLRSLVAAFGAAGVAVSLAYVVPGWETSRPWNPGEPLPLARSLLPQAEARGVEDDKGELVAAPVAVDPGRPPVDDLGTGGAVASSDRVEKPVLPGAAQGPPTGNDPGVAAPIEVSIAADPSLPPRPPGVPQALVDPGHRGMAPFYRALSRGEGLARAAHYGDSTIAADGISGTVRSRLQARFGNGGPGFISAGNDPRWSVRPDVKSSKSGDWETVTILLGGGKGRYGYGGTASNAADGAYVVVHAPKGADGAPVPMSRLDLYMQTRPGAGQWWASVDDHGVGGGTAASEARADAVQRLSTASTFTKLAFGASGGPVTFYGAVMETSGPGVVWDALGVVGVGSKSFKYHDKTALAAQVAERSPDLVVVMIGGNETGFPAVMAGKGEGYQAIYREAVQILRGGAPAAGCLLVTPLDQGTREGGTPRSKPAMAKMVAAQRAVAEAEGCAFWDARAAMGGDGAIVRWSTRKPTLAWADLLHLSAAGQDLVGNMLADAIEAGHAGWLAEGSP